MAQSANSAAVSHATSDVLIANGLGAVDTGVDTKFVLLTAACISIVSSRLPLVRQYSHAIAAESAVTPTRYAGNDWPDLSVPETKKNGKCQHAQIIPTIMLATGSPTRLDRRGNAYPRQPSSSPAWTGVENTIAANIANQGV